MTRLVDFIRPSGQSPIAGAIDELHIHDRYAVTNWDRFLLRTRACKTIALFIIHDLASWVLATVKLRPMWNIGFCNHLANLTSTLALCILLLGIPFGNFPSIDVFRPTYSLVDFEPPYAPSLIDRFSNWYFPDQIRYQRILDNLSSRQGIDGLKGIFPGLVRFGRPFGHFVESLRKACLALNKPGILAEFRNLLPIADLFIQQSASLGCDFNQLDRHGRTLWMDYIFFCPREVVAFLEGKGEPAIALPINPRIRTPEGLDLLTLWMLGLRSYESTYAIWTVDEVSEEIYFQLIGKLLQKGAFLEDTRFEAYRDFLLEIQKFPNKQDPSCTEFLTRNCVSNNRYISLVARLLLDGKLEIVDEWILGYADRFVQGKSRIEALWAPHRARYLAQYTSTLREAFQGLSQAVSESADVAPQTLGGDPKIVGMVAECLMGEPPILTMAP